MYDFCQLPNQLTANVTSANLVTLLFLNQIIP